MASATTASTSVSWKGRLLGLTFMCALTVVLCEIVLSLHGGLPFDGYMTVHQRSETPGLNYEPSPAASTRLATSDYNTAISFNSYGMRGPEPSPPDREGVIRVAAVGDSFTFGMGVEAEQAWPTLLQERLSREERPVETLNFGVCGYSAVEDLAVLEHKTPQWRPRVIVLGYFFNDPDTLPLQPLQQAYLPTFSPYRLKLGAFALMLRRYLEMRLAPDGTTYYELVHSDSLPYWEKTLDAFDRMAAKAREMDATLIATIFPSVPPDWNHFKLKPLHEKVGAALRERGIQTIDLLPELSRYEPSQVRISLEDPHPTPFGHQVIADALAPAVEAAIERQALSMR